MARFKIFDGTNWVELIKSSDFNGYFANAVNNPAYNPTIVKSSPRNFENGTLITTAIDYSVDNGAAFYMEIKGDLYRNGQLFTQVHGYIYYGSIINYGVNNLSDVRITQLIAMNIDGHLCFWFPRLGYWHSFSVVVNISSDGDYHSNYVISVTDSADVTTATKRIDLAYGHEIYSINSANIGSQSVSNADTVDGEHAAAFAHRATDEDLIAHGNEFNFVPSGYGTVSAHSSTTVYFNYRTAGGTNGNITEYVLGNGAGGALGTIIHSGNIGSQSVAYASNADTVDNKHATDFTQHKGNINGSIPSGSPAADVKIYFANSIANDSVNTAYNTNGAEYSFIFSKASSGLYGSILKWGYDDKYMRILRYSSGGWASTDWEKMNAGYADSAGSVDWSNVSNRPTNVSSFTNDSGYITSSALSGYATQTWVGNNYQPAGSYAGTSVATQSANGLMSATDKTNLDAIVASLNNDDNDSVVNRLKDVLSVFQDYPEGTTVLSALNGKLSLSGGTLTGALFLGDSNHRISQEDGTTLTNGSRSFALPNSSGKGIAILADEGGDYGLCYIGSDGALIANSGDTGYVLRVYDKDIGSDMFKVGQNSVASYFAGDLQVNGAISEGGTLLSNKYLGINAKAADSDKLDGNDSSYFINTSNIGSQSVNYANSAGSAPASDVYSWAKASSKPSYTASEVGALPLSGGTMTGPLSWSGGTALPSKTLQYILGIDAFASGGQTGWQSKSDFLSGYATETWVGNNYLGKTAKAADSDKLDNHDSTYFINTDNIGSQSVNYANSAGSATDSTKIPLSGSTSITGSLIPNATDSIDLGGASKRWNNIYGKNIIVSTDAGKFELQGGNNTCATMKVDNQSGNLKFTLVDNGGNTSGTYTLENTGSNATIATQTWVGNQGYLTSVSYSMVVNALGYTPPTQDHTYNFAGTTFNSGNSGTAEHNANNAVDNGVYYYNSNGPSTSLGASTGDGALYTQAYSSSWVGQIAQDYRNGRLFVRAKHSGSWTDWKRIAQYEEIPTVPTNVSAFTNDVGYISSVPYTYSSVNVNFNRRIEATCLTATTPYDLASYANAYYYADMIICENSNSAKTHKFLLPYYSKLNETFTEEIIATRTWASSKIYRHNIYIYGGGNSYIRFSIDSTINTAMNAKQAIEALYGSLTNNATSHVPVAFFSDSFNRYGIGANHFINNINYSGNILKVFQINFSYCMSGMYRDCYVESMYAYFNESNGLSCTDNFYEI